MLDFLNTLGYRFARIMVPLVILAMIPVGFSDSVVTTSHPKDAVPAANSIPVLSTGHLFNGPDGETVAIPEGAPIDTTPVVCWAFTDAPDGTPVVCVPEESPTGSRVTDWQDNSPVYGEAEWRLLVNDTARTVEWQYLPDASQSV